MSKKTAAPSKTMVQEVFALARLQGWTSLNPREKQLIELLRNTTWHGRDLVFELALSIRQSHPWIDGSPNNTQTNLPENVRAFHHAKES